MLSLPQRFIGPSIYRFFHSVGLIHNFLVDFPSFEELARLTDDGLFRSISSNPDHALRHYFKDKNPTGRNLRPVVITLLFLEKTLVILILYPVYFMQFCFRAIICLFFAKFLNCLIISLCFAQLLNCLIILAVMYFFVNHNCVYDSDDI